MDRATEVDAVPLSRDPDFFVGLGSAVLALACIIAAHFGLIGG